MPLSREGLHTVSEKFPNPSHSASKDYQCRKHIISHSENHTMLKRFDTLMCQIDKSEEGDIQSCLRLFTGRKDTFSKPINAILNT